VLLAGALAHTRAALLGFFLALERLVRASLRVHRRFLLVMEDVLEPIVVGVIGVGLWREENEKRGEEQ
jgi:hypothetical protein